MRRNFEFNVKFFVSKAKLGDGSVRDIKRDTIVRLEVEFSDIDPQELQILEEKAVKNVVEKLGESVLWGPEQEVALLRFDNWKGEYVRIENGEDMVEEIDRQDGWTSKQVTFRAELVDLKSDSKVGYVPSKLASQMLDDDWASRREVVPIRTDVTVLAEGADADAVVVCVDWNSVELADTTDSVIAPMEDTEMAEFFGIPVDDRDKEKEKKKSDDRSYTGEGNKNSFEGVDKELMEEAAADVDNEHDEELVTVYDKETLKLL